MTIKITLLIGLGNSGKSTTIREFASLNRHKLKRGVNKFLINNKLIFVYNSSPQEKSAYCNFKDVNRRIDNFINSKVKPDLTIDSNKQYRRQAQELKDFIDIFLKVA